MHEDPVGGVRVFGRNRLIVDIVGQMVGSLGTDGAAVAVLVDPGEEHWELATELDAPVVLIAEDLADDRLVDAVLRGALAVIPPDELLVRLPEAVGTVREGGALLTPVQTRALADALRRRPTAEPVRLTRRESQIIESIAGGDSVKQTALRLGITPKTVENLQGRLFRKLEVRNRAQAVAKAHDLALLDGTGSHPMADGGIAP